ncbi:MAG: 7-carboxy-7-deazaguanine synthase QueE [Sedimentisphaerales bacterium]|nr:7-carboxy-7-deazaguanine synthase QueE [Sedimentisphaerales bacterium]
MVVNEIFYSLQGEGFLAGVPSVFVRLAGCPLRCRWCDTKYAWEEDAGRDCTIVEIVETVCKHRCPFVVITGGEPMMDLQVRQLARELKALEKHITIETAGIAYIPDIPCDVMSISPKLSNSMPEDVTLAALHKDSRLELAVLGELAFHYNCQFKFVIDSENDLTEVQEIIDSTGNIDAGRVMLMPQAATKEELLAKSPMVADMCKLAGFAFSQRLQVLLWNNEKGT